MTAAFAALALAATAAWALVLVDVHRRKTGYDPLRDAVSDYGVGAHRAWYRAQTACSALAAVCLLAALASGSSAPAWLLALLAVYAAARVAIPWYPTDLDRGRPTRTGLVHLLLAAVAFAAIAVAAGGAPHHLAPRHLRRAVVLTAVATGLGVRLRFPYFGLVERLFYLATIVWFAWTAAALL